MKQVAQTIKFALTMCVASGLSIAGSSTPSTTALTTPGPSGAVNVAVALTARITPNTANGLVTFFDGATVIGSATASQGIAVLTYVPYFAGKRSLRAYYRGSGPDNPSYSPAISFTVQPVASGSLGNFEFYDSETTESSPVIGDFNNDGAPDSAVLTSDGAVILLVNVGMGSHNLTTPISGLNHPGGMVAGDFDGDGNLDLAIADTQDSQVALYRGRGDGTFYPAVNYSTGNPCYAIAAGDFNGDGIADLITENGSNGLSLLINNGDGTFQAAVNSSVPGTLNGLAVGDFNRDGVADIAVIDTSASAVEILFGSPTGFSTPASYTVGAPVGLAVTDFNGDGIVDLAVVNSLSVSTSILLGNADGTFQTQYSTGDLPGPEPFIAVGDLDGDGVMDFMVTGDYICVSMGKGDGTFYPPYCNEFDTTTGIALGSADLTGTTDVLLTGPGEAYLHGGPFLPVIVSGDSQTIPGGTSAASLQVQLLDFNHPYQVAGLPVTFTAPAQGPGGYFMGLGTSATVNTAADGTATAPSYVTNSAAGAYSVSAGNPNALVNFSLTNSAPVADSIPCSYTVSPEAAVFNSNGGSVSFSVVPAPAGCAWSASSNASWISTSGTDFTGASQVTVTAPANLSGNTQNGDLLIAGQYVKVMQWGTAPVVSDGGALTPEITDMIGYGFSSGCSAVPLDYCPDSPVTRAQAAILLVRGVYGNDNFSYSITPHFNDVNASSFGFQWIQKLFELGITSGCGNGNYCPDMNLPRDQAAILIVRSRFGSGTPFNNPQTPYFTDVPANAFAFSYIQRLRMDNITAGCTPTAFCPSQPVTRGELAVFIMRALTNQFLPTGMPLISEVTSANQPVRSLFFYQTTTLIIRGQNTHFDQTSSIVVAGGIATSNFTVYSPTYATVDVQGDGQTLRDEPDSIIITTGSEQAVMPNAIMFEGCDLC